MVEFYKNELS